MSAPSRAPLYAHAQTFRLAVMRLPNSSLIQALQARFYGVFKGDPKLMLSHFMQVRQREARCGAARARVGEGVRRGVVRAAAGRRRGR